jgi:hypothetical protein
MVNLSSSVTYGTDAFLDAGHVVAATSTNLH